MRVRTLRVRRERGKMKEKTVKRGKEGERPSKRQCEDYRVLLVGPIVVSPLFSTLSLRRSRVLPHGRAECSRSYLTKGCFFTRKCHDDTRAGLIERNAVRSTRQMRPRSTIVRHCASSVVPAGYARCILSSLHSLLRPIQRR